MALSDANIGVYVSKELAEYTAGAYADYGSTKDQLHHFARAIEAEVRKQDDALTLQLVDALEHILRCIPMGGFAQIHWDSASFEQIVQAAEAGRARLEGKP